MPRTATQTQRRANHRGFHEIILVNLAFSIAFKLRDPADISSSRDLPLVIQLDGGLNPAFGARLFAFGFSNPLDVFPFVAGTEILERGQCLLVFLECRQKIIRHDDCLFRLRLGTRSLDSGFVEFDGFPDVAGQDFVAGQFGNGSETTKLRLLVLAQEQSALPKNERAMPFERRRGQQNSFVLEKRRSSI